MPDSKLDRELQRVLSDADGAVPGYAPVKPGGALPRKRGNLGLLAILLVMGGAIVALIMTSFKDAAVYAKSVDMLAAAPVEPGRRLRVEGLLVHGSLERRDQPCEYRFEMEKNSAKMKVRFPQCVVPDTFRDVPGMDVGVTVEGKLVKAGEFDATQVLAKCPSKYEMKDRAARGEQMPHVPVPSAPDPLRSEL